MHITFDPNMSRSDAILMWKRIDRMRDVGAITLSECTEAHRNLMAQFAKYYDSFAVIDFPGDDEWEEEVYYA